MSQAEKTTDLKEIARQLSDSYYKILQHSTLNEQTIQECLNLLSKYSNDLPISWFTHDFLDGLFILQKKYAKNGTSPIVVLLSGWLRRNSEADEIREDLALDILRSALLEYNDDLALQKEAWIGWVAMIGKGKRDMKLLEGMTSVLEIYSQDAIKADYMAEPIDAGVAHALAHTNTMNDFEIDHCQKLLRVHTTLVSKKGFHGLCSLMTIAEHVVDVRSREEPQTRVEAVLSTFVQLTSDIKDDYARLAFLAGTLRTLQFSLIKMTKKLIKLRQEIEKEFIHQLNIALDSNDTMTHQDSLSYFAARCLIQVPVEQLESISNAQLLKVLTSSLLTSPFTFHHGEPFSRLENTKEMVDQLNALTEQSLFREVGRMSRTIAKLVELLINEKKEQFTVQHVLDRLLGFSYNVFIDWDQFIAKYSSKRMTPEENSNYKDLETGAWTLLKSVLFSFTVILKSVAVDVPNGQGLVEVPHAAQDIISIFANLHFIAQHLGQGAGLQAYQDTLTNTVAYLLHKENQCQLNKLMSVAFKEYAHAVYTKDTTNTVELLSITKQTRLLFFTDLTEQVMKSIDDEVLEQHILPVIYPVLKWKRIENRDLYESAHTVVLNTFLTKKPVSRELAGVYAKILIDNFPEPMNLDQFRYGFNTMVQALCEMDDALSWLTVNQLIEKINSLDQEKDILLRSQYSTALIDLLRPLSLGPFFRSILDQVQKMVVSQETKAMQQATMKIIFDTVSGSGISDMRRTEAVGWYLDLKRQLQL
ncbi:hypothetical protein G6F57_008853 [Rhizopus arrhizus]|uniref:Uncharacterized protein n=1 Tax=Rhizopus oryzae TaxID=64495 RepID=A0A9P6XJB3_RHIOR|nr:hypothetical protein G6F23_003948 [Rhizopus arrhizus]KAG1415409.1 hypothetical protein G6F58_006498 [Rhizopus delemar]KAG0950299.1 hypothetical protein G6F30_001771 [Rhizopus arrhizus]KAG0990311.1 hypothetical protein G6F29_000320 [Rhizopus arrhizus]KAG0999230.1 hypothetical protein G6F28_001199 [Rhizopus arrhizus]